MSIAAGTEIKFEEEIPGAPSRPARIIGQKKKIQEARRMMLEFIAKGGDLRRMPWCDMI
jgi:hypothetical protein